MNKTCFVEMAFDPRFQGIWEHVIKPTVEGLGDKCIRADDFFTVGSILQDIFNSINNSDYIIAELTIHNPNVYYELGYSHALNKKVILLTQDISTLPFDLRHQRVIVYSDNASGISKLKTDLTNFINKL